MQKSNPSPDTSLVADRSPSGLSGDASVAIPLSATRIIWLEHCAKHGETAWSAMPRSKRGRPVTNLTWRPMIDHGLLAGKYKTVGYRTDWFFAITDAGRAALAKAKASAP